MNTALAQKLDLESADMEPAEERQLVGHVLELRADVRHLQSDVTEIKSDIKSRFEKVDERFKGVDARLNEIVGMISSAKLWAFGLYVALSGTLLYVIARSAKWL